MISPNMLAFLAMIAYSELGPQLIAKSDRGYNVIVGSSPAKPDLFRSYADHPRKLVTLGPSLKSTAAGRYQILSRTFDAYKTQLGLKDFSPESQDAIALQMIRECHAVDDIEHGRIATAISKCSSRWASLPGAGYGQHENGYPKLASAFSDAGGKIV